MALERLPDPWLDSEGAAHLNGIFYGGEPHEYFMSRLALLLVAAGRPEVIEDAIRSGVIYEGLEIRARSGGAAEPEDDDKREAARQREFVIAETLVLVNHVTETLLRYYLAHEGRRQCPWVEIATERPMEKFKAKVATRFDGRPLTKARRKALGTVFFGTEKPRPEEEAAERETDLQNIETWLNHFAGRFLDDATAWNALKHGLAVRPGEPVLQVGRVRGSGPGVTYLERDEEDKRVWKLTSLWLTPFTLPHVIAEVHVACGMLHTIWRVGSARYMRESGSVSLTMPPPFEVFMTSAKPEGVFRKVSANVLFAYGYPPDLVCSDCGRTPREGEHARRSWRMQRVADGVPLVFCADCARRREASG